MKYFKLIFVNLIMLALLVLIYQNCSQIKSVDYSSTNQGSVIPPVDDPPPPPEDDPPPGPSGLSFEELCKLDGVVYCNGFDSIADFQEGSFDSNPKYTHPEIDNEQAASGAGSLKVPITNNQQGGGWRKSFRSLAPGGNGWGSGEDFYFHYKFRLESTFVSKINVKTATLLRSSSGDTLSRGDSGSFVVDKIRPGHIIELVDPPITLQVAAIEGAVSDSVIQLATSNKVPAFSGDLSGTVYSGVGRYDERTKKFHSNILASSVSNSNKFWIWWNGSASCAASQFVGTNAYFRGKISGYSSCGDTNWSYSIGNGDYYNQQGDFNCHYHDEKNKEGTLESCAYFRHNIWISYLLHFRLGTAGVPNTVLEVWVDYPDDSKGWMKIVSRTGKPINGVTHPLLQMPSVGPIENLLLTTYQTGKDLTLTRHDPTGYWYDDFLVSNKNIFGVDAE